MTITRRRVGIPHIPFSNTNVIDFSNAAKGAVAETAVLCALRAAGYSVQSTAVESILPILPLLDKSRYQALELPSALRLVPDLLIFPPEVGAAAILVEVKFRSRFDKDMLRQFARVARVQQEIYPSTHTVLIRGVAPGDGPHSVDEHVRVLAPENLDLLSAAQLFYAAGEHSGTPEPDRLEPVWNALQPLVTAFPNLEEHAADLDRLVPLFGVLADL